MANNSAPGRIALFYAVTGCLWILFSDQLMALLFHDPATILLVSEFKGWGFITVTALLLFWLIRDSRDQLVRSEAELRRKNLALAENRELLLRYELLASNSRDIILFLRRDDGRVLEANAAATATYGYDHQELLAMTIQELRAPDASAETSTQMAAADAHGLLFETVHRRKDGTTFPVEVSSQGATIGGTRTLISVIRDITRRRQTEASLRLWADAFASCAHGMAIGNPSTDTILTCNPAFARLHGQTVEEMSGVPIPDLYAPTERDQVRQWLAAADQAGTTRYESVMQRRDGSCFPVQVDVVSVRTADGQLLHRVVTVQDITERTQWEERTAHLASFPQLDPNPVLEVDILRRVVFCNASCLQVLEECDLDNEKAVRFLPADLDRIMADWDKASIMVHQREVVIGERFFAESVFLAPQLKVVRIYAYEITGRKRAEAALQQAHDDLEQRVAERTAELVGALESLKKESAERLRAVEELQEKERLLMHQSRLAALGEMVGNIAHQWRQPLNSLALLIQHAKHLYDSGLLTSEDAEEASEQAMALINHMSQTIDDFRNFFRPDKERVRFPVHEAVTKAVGLVEDSLRELQITVEVSCEGAPQAIGYPNEYAQVLLNILLNARDAFAEQSCSNPHIAICSFTVNGRAVVTITDNAGGIPPAIIQQIFDPYFSTKGVQGTGVGLYMAKNIIENNMHGSITARNTGDGAEFRIEI